MVAVILHPHPATPTTPNAAGDTASDVSDGSRRRKWLSAVELFLGEEKEILTQPDGSTHPGTLLKSSACFRYSQNYDQMSGVVTVRGQHVKFICRLHFDIFVPTTSLRRSQCADRYLGRSETRYVVFLFPPDFLFTRVCVCVQLCVTVNKGAQRSAHA